MSNSLAPQNNLSLKYNLPQAHREATLQLENTCKIVSEFKKMLLLEQRFQTNTPFSGVIDAQIEAANIKLADLNKSITQINKSFIDLKQWTRLPENIDQYFIGATTTLDEKGSLITTGKSLKEWEDFAKAETLLWAKKGDYLKERFSFNRPEIQGDAIAGQVTVPLKLLVTSMGKGCAIGASIGAIADGSYQASREPMAKFNTSEFAVFTGLGCVAGIAGNQFRNRHVFREHNYRLREEEFAEGLKATHRAEYEIARHMISSTESEWWAAVSALRNKLIAIQKIGDLQVTGKLGKDLKGFLDLTENMPLGTKIRDSIIRKTVRIHREREQIPALSEMPELGAANGQGIIFMHRLIKLEELRTLVSGRLPTAEIRKVTRPILEKFYGKQAARLEKELGQGTKLTQKEVFLIRDLTPVVVARAPEYGGVVSGYNWRVMSNIPDVGTQVPRILTLVNEGKTFVLRGPYAQNSKVTYRVADSGVKEVTSQELQQGISLPRSAVVEIDGLSIHLENVAKSIR